MDKRRADTPRGFPRTKPTLPTPNEVSDVVFQPNKIQGQNTKKLAVIFMTVGQFLDHDMAFVTHGKCKSNK